MAETPKIPKRGRSSLSLSKRLNKRLPSPQPIQQNKENATALQDSPKVSFNIEYTPPHKKINLDESLDDSPMSFEESCSPTSFLSQTFGSEGLDVTWCWTQDEFIGGKTKIQTDCGISPKNRRNAIESRRNRELSRQAYYKKVEERRRAKEAKIRKAERERLENILRERIATLEAKFKGVHTSAEHIQKDEDIIAPDVDVIKKTPTKSEFVFDDIDNIFEESNIDFDSPKPKANEKNDKQLNSIDEFFNDSDTDCLLVAATQQLESKIPELSQPKIQTSKSESPKCSTTTHTTNNDRRSSLYMKFLEDDEDDFFVSLDDDWLKRATQTTKPRSPFQRYKSMPTSTTATFSSISLGDAATSNNKQSCSNSNNNHNATNKASTSHSIKAIKRHASSHAMSPSNTKYRGRRLPSRD